MMRLVLGFAILFGVLVLVIIYAVARLLARGPDSAASAEDALLAQDMHRMLERLEARVDVLETLLAQRPDQPGDPWKALEEEERRKP